MKIRTGFVSNSSSSSFVVITTDETFNKVKTLCYEDEWETILSFLGYSEKTAIDNNNKIVYLGEIYTSDHNDDDIALLESFFNHINKYPDSYAIMRQP
jgi:hypothetical protein